MTLPGCTIAIPIVLLGCGQRAGADSTTPDAHDSAAPADAPSDDTGEPPAPCPPFVPVDDDRLSRVLTHLTRTLGPTEADLGPSGASVAIVYDGALLHVAGVGTQGKTGHDRAVLGVGPDTMFWIASTSKWVTGVAAMSLVDAGALDLHAPVTALLPDYAETRGRQDDITLHHLMRMKSGLLNDGGCYLYSESASEEPGGCAAFTDGPGTVLEALFQPEALLRAPYNGSMGINNSTENGAPGAAPWLYSNWGVMLTGRLMEAASGQPFESIVADRVFAPAKMCTAGFSADDMTQDDDYAVGGGANAVDGYCPEPERGHDSRQPFYPDELACPARHPNGGVRASAVDMGRFAEALLADLDGAGRLMRPVSATAMLCPDGGSPGAGCAGRADTNGSSWGESYGYFNFAHSEQGRDVYSHGGGRAGYGALFWVVPDARFAVIILGNDDGVASEMPSVARTAMRCYLDGDC